MNRSILALAATALALVLLGGLASSAWLSALSGRPTGGLLQPSTALLQAVPSPQDGGGQKEQGQQPGQMTAFSLHSCSGEHFLWPQAGRLQHPAATADPDLVTAGQAGLRNALAVDPSFKGAVELPELQAALSIQADFNMPRRHVFIVNDHIAAC